VRVEIGTASSPAGAVIMPTGTVSDSTLSVSGDSVMGTAIGTDAANSLSTAAAGVSDGGGLDGAAAGSLPAGYGAAATFALANNQKLGEPSMDGSSTAQIGTIVDGRYGIAGTALAENASLTVEGNSQRANALGNTAVNRVGMSATSLSSDGAGGPSTALSSSQFGQAIVTAFSDLGLETLGNLAASSASLSGNSNQALAAINDVDNGLSIDALASDGTAGNNAHGEVGSLGSAAISGDHVLASTQFATGSVGASALTSIGNAVPASALDASRFTIADNVTGADASANRAINTVSVDTGAVGFANAGLVSSQMSDAGVTSAAASDAVYALSALPALPCGTRRSRSPGTRPPHWPGAMLQPISSR
jgi:hypothetical protein